MSMPVDDPMVMCLSNHLDDWMRRAMDAERENKKLRDAIAAHHAQKADDRCWEDDDRLYEAAGLQPADHRVGDQCAMLKNCERFITQRTLGGGWPAYAELEARIKQLEEESAFWKSQRSRPREER